MGRGNGQIQATGGAQSARSVRGGVAKRQSKKINEILTTPEELSVALEGVVSATFETPGKYTIVFKDGSKALVDTNANSVAFAAGEYTEDQLQAALVAAHSERSRYVDPLGADDEELVLADALGFVQDNPDEAAMMAYAKAGGNYLLSQDGNVTVNAPKLRAELASIESGNEEAAAPYSPRLQARKRAQALQSFFKEAAAIGGVRGPVNALAMGVNRAEGPSDFEIEERSDAAKQLGVEIPESRIDLDPKEDGTFESKGAYHVGEAESARFSVIRNRIALGNRSFILRGPPGTGKDSFMQEVAAIYKMPMQVFNIGPTFSLEDAIGGDGLEATQVVDKNGNISQAPQSAQIKGPLARALEHPCMVVIQEPEGFENDMVRIHSVFGDNVGAPESRYLTFNSSSGEQRLDVHKDAIVALTYNPGKEDIKFKTALHDRACNLDFEYPDAEQEAERIAKMVTRVMAREEVKDEAPGLSREYSAEEVMPMVRYMETLRNAHKENPDVFIEMPGSRTTVHSMCDLLMQGYIGDKFAREHVMLSLNHLLRGSDNIDPTERGKNLREMMTDVTQDIHKITQFANSLNKETA